MFAVFGDCAGLFLSLMDDILKHLKTLSCNKMKNKLFTIVLACLKQQHVWANSKR